MWALVGPDVAVDGFMTDGQGSTESEPPGDLLETPIGLEERLHPYPIGRSEALVPSGAGAAAAGVSIREDGTSHHDGCGYGAVLVSRCSDDDPGSGRCR